MTQSDMSRAAKRKLPGCRSGAGAVEFALAIPILLLIVAGIAELGRVIYTQDALANAVREAARTAIVKGSNSGDPYTAEQIQALVKARAPTLAPEDMDVTVTFTPNNDPQSVVTVQASYPLVFIMPPFSAFGPVLLSRTTSLVISN